MNVPSGITLLLGGARSGKSALAVQLGRRWRGDVAFVATARVDSNDEDLAARVRRHRAERPPQWHTVETTDVLDGIQHVAKDALVIVDCITLWVASLFDEADGARRAETEVSALVESLGVRGGPSVLVSNEVGLGVHPETHLGREFRDTLGRVNTTLAARACRSVLLVAGRAVVLEDPWTQLA